MSVDTRLFVRLAPFHLDLESFSRRTKLKLIGFNRIDDPVRRAFSYGIAPRIY